MKAPTDAQLRRAVLRWTRAKCGLRAWKPIGRTPRLNVIEWNRMAREQCKSEAALLALGKRMEEE